MGTAIPRPAFIYKYIIQTNKETLAMDFKKKFKNRLKNSLEGFDISSNPSDFLNQISEELSSEQESNKVLKFKKQLSKTKQKIKEESVTEILEQFLEALPTEKSYINEIVLPIKEEPENIPLEIDYISAVADIISKEESLKVKEDTNLFSEPNAKTEPSLYALQNKVKFLEDWIYKISAAGPGSGEVNFRWLDDVNRNSIGDTDQILRYNPNDKKFFFGQLSGDQGKIRSLQFEQTGSGIPSVPGMITWNSTKDCLDVYQNDDTTLQVGLESYIRVYNTSGNTLNNGTIVRFAGVDSNSDTPICLPMIANSSSVPLYMVGVLTNEIANGSFGRATVLGEVRNLDTTGNTYNEVWNVGDLLWVSPTIPGGYTKTRPTAPNTVISIAAVLKKDSSNGILLVRPTIYERHYYGSFYDTTEQITTVNTATPVKINSVQIASGFHIANNSQIVAENAGLYNYQFSIQAKSSSSSTQNMSIWYRKNGVNVNNSSTVISLDSNKSVVVPAWNFIESMNAGDHFELVWAVDNSGVVIANNVVRIDNSPDIPSVILTVTQVAL